MSKSISFLVGYKSIVTICFSNKISTLKTNDILSVSTLMFIEFLSDVAFKNL